MKKMEQCLIDFMEKDNSNRVYTWDYCIKALNLNQREYMQFLGELKYFIIVERKYKYFNNRTYSYFEFKEKR
ncbi:hypothetical protein CUM97_11130 [Enterococcus mundtii]|nr:hypothetical protein CUM97_11130 [Enterococcus mundtii]